ncbi:MAG: hypothetical protein H6831_00575 [Planctomycetes bacterium]|nr:hypothetical protein [Planctomycetota bacterium]MCB9902878.1 hypothetical protein [Planctomycetota bacterium]
MKALTLLGLLFATPLLLAPRVAQESRWSSDLAAAHELALESGKPLLIAFR